MKPEPVKVNVRGDDDVFWVQCLVGGFFCGERIPVESIEHGDAVAEPLLGVLKRCYETAYKHGTRDAQKAVRNAIGYTEDL